MKGKIAFVDSLHNDIGKGIFQHITELYQNDHQVVRVSAIDDLPGPESVARWINENGIDGIIYSGSLASVNDDESWIAKQVAVTVTLLKPDAPDVPVLGLCFGHQIFAKAAGVPIKKHSKPYVGVRALKVVERSDFFDGMSDIRGFVYHEDEVVTLPENFVLTVTNDEVPIHGMRHATKPMYSFQSHPEVPFHIGRMFDASLETDTFPTTDGKMILMRFADLVRGFVNSREQSQS